VRLPASGAGEVVAFPCVLCFLSVLRICNYGYSIGQARSRPIARCVIWGSSEGSPPVCAAIRVSENRPVSNYRTSARGSRYTTSRALRTTLWLTHKSLLLTLWGGWRLTILIAAEASVVLHEWRWLRRLHIRTRQTDRKAGAVPGSPPTHCEQEASRREIDSFRLVKGRLFGPRFDHWEQRRIGRGSEERQ
jgi:hypothetical protein